MLKYASCVSIARKKEKWKKEKLTKKKKDWKVRWKGRNQKIQRERGERKISTKSIIRRNIIRKNYDKFIDHILIIRTNTLGDVSTKNKTHKEKKRIKNIIRNLQIIE